MGGWGFALVVFSRTVKRREHRILNEATTTGSWKLAVPILGVVFCTSEHRGHNLWDGSREVHGHLPRCRHLLLRFGPAAGSSAVLLQQGKGFIVLCCHSKPRDFFWP